MVLDKYDSVKEQQTLDTVENRPPPAVGGD